MNYYFLTCVAGCLHTRRRQEEFPTSPSSSDSVEDTHGYFSRHRMQNLSYSPVPAMALRSGRDFCALLQGYP